MNKCNANVIRVMAREGDFNAYRLLATNRIFLFLKNLRCVFLYFFGSSDFDNPEGMVFIKGENQLRHHTYTKNLRESKFGMLSLCSDASIRGSGVSLVPRLRFGDVLVHVFYLVLMLVTGKRRYLNLFYYAFYRSIFRMVVAKLSNVRVMVCYNDQPFDVAALITALHVANDCDSIVIQHGLIINHKFYFPAVAKKFLAWGDSSRKYYKSHREDSELIVVGRYSEDVFIKKDSFLVAEKNGALSVLLAPSPYYGEIRSLVDSIRPLVGVNRKNDVAWHIKLHPSTKLKLVVWAFFKLKFPFLKMVSDNMEVLSEKCDVLITRNSTSAVDFLLRGKPVMFEFLFGENFFPSNIYGLSISENSFKSLYSRESLVMLNSARLSFLRSALNV